MGVAASTDDLVAIAIAFFIGSLMLVPLIPKGLIDNGDLGLSTVSVELPPGSTLEETKSCATGNRANSAKPSR
jgi:multidrug efflux pump subunit AcrB